MDSTGDEVETGHPALRAATDGERGISIEESAREAVDAHAMSKTAVEVGGVLVGYVDEASGDVLVTAAVPAHQATSAVASLTFTHEAWEEVNEILARDYEGQKMVGWYHTHPRFGIFLSSYDLFIHSNFFSEPWQVAYVVDPIGDNAGFFGWSNGEIVRYKAWTIVNGGSGKAVGEPDRRAPTPRSSSENTAASALEGEEQGGWRHATRRLNGPSLLLIVVLAGVLIALLWWTFGGTSSSKGQASRGHTTSASSRPGRVKHEAAATGSVLVSSPDDKGQLMEQWTWEPSPYGGYWEYVVTLSLSSTAIEPLRGTVLNCAPSGLVPVLSQTSLQVDACDLSYLGGLTRGTADVFEFLAPAGIQHPEAVSTEPVYIYKQDVPKSTLSASAIKRLDALANKAGPTTA
jgi:proteasome lid subunit RPN8/RPN11